MDNREDILNKIAGKITNFVHGIGTGPCDLCEDFAEYTGKCIGYSWDLTYFPPTLTGEQGTWNFSLYHHRKEIWYLSKDGTVADIILLAYEKLISGQWKEDIEKWKEEKELLEKTDKKKDKGF